jgi:hypothetical protein
MLDDNQLYEATAILRGAWRQTTEHKGGYCTVCDRWGKINTLPLTGSMVRALLWLHREHAATGEMWINVPERAPRHVMRSYAISTLKHWNLVAQRYAPPPTKEEIKAGAPRKTKTSGMWQITAHGIDFLNEAVKVPKKLFIYNDTRMGASDDLVTARECFEQEFNYDEMMASTYAHKGDIQLDNGEEDESNHD